MKTVKRFWIPAVLLLLVAGCAPATFQPTGACVDGESVILGTTGGNPSGLDKTLLMVNFAALEKGHYTAEQAQAFLSEIDAKLASGISYIDMADWLGVRIRDINRYAGVSLIILGDSAATIGAAGGALPVSACDQQLIQAHIAHQRQIAALY